MEKILKYFSKIRKKIMDLLLFFRKQISKMEFKYFLPYFLLLSVILSVAFLSLYYVMPMYQSYVREKQDVAVLKTKIRLDYEKARIYQIIRSFNSGLSVSEEKNISALIYDLGVKYNLNPALILAVIRVESSFNNFSRSDVGAVGLMQLDPGTALYLIKKYNIKSKKINYNTRYLDYLPEAYLYDPSLNIRIGARYLMALLNRFKNLKLALFAYNVGPTAAYRACSVLKGKIAGGAVYGYAAGSGYGFEEASDVRFSGNAEKMFSEFYKGYYKKVKRYFGVYDHEIFKQAPQFS